MDTPLRQAFQLSEWEVRPIEGQMTGPDGTVHLEPKVMEVLVCLASNPGHVVERDDIIAAVWGKRAVSDEPLTRCIAALRRELRDSVQTPRFVQTVPKRGYRLVSSVKPLHSSAKDKHRLLVAALVGVALIGSIYPAYRWVTNAPPVSPTLAVAGAVRSETDVNSVAVLPFVNMSSDTGQDYFSDGITEEISSALARTPNLRVTSRTSVYSLKGQDLDVPTIAERLGVAYVLEGSVRRSGDDIRIVAKLIDANTDQPLWSLTYDRKLSDIFAVQDEISRTVVDELQASLGLETDIVEQLGQKVSLDAYDLYLRGLHAFNVGTVEANLRAEELFEQAIDIEATYAAAYYRLARVRLALIRAGRANVVGILAAANKAIDLNPRLGGAYTVVSLVAPLWNVEKLELRGKALEMTPGDSFVVLHYGRALEWNYRKHEADLYIQRAVQLDPLNPEIQTIYGRFNMFRGRAEKALQIFDRVIETNPDYAPAYADKGRTLAEFGGNLLGGTLALNRAIEIDPNMQQWQLWAALWHLALGDNETAKYWIDRVGPSGSDSILINRVTAEYLQLSGRGEQARKLALRVFEERGPGLTDRFLMHLLVGDMIARHSFSEAEAFLLNYEPEFPRLLNSPMPNNRMEFDHGLVPSYWAAMLQHVYKLNEKHAEADDLAERLRFSGLEGSLSYDFETTNYAYLAEATRLIRAGQPREALSALRTAIDMGRRISWQYQIRDNPIFAELHGYPEFQSLITTIVDDMDEQRWRLASQLAGSD